MAEQERGGYPDDFPWDGAFVVPDVQAQPWWPHRPVAGRVDALWLLGRDAAADGAFGRVAAWWAGRGSWLAAGTALGMPGSAGASWTRAWPDLAGVELGRVTVEAPGGMVARTEWRRLTPAAEQLAALLASELLHPGQGWWLVACPEGVSEELFFPATTGLVAWRTRQQHVHAGPEVEAVDEGVKETLLALLPHLGLVSVVPLNGHPVAGVVLLGPPVVIAAAAEATGEVRLSPQGDEVSALLRRGCWLATN